MTTMTTNKYNAFKDFYNSKSIKGSKKSDIQRMWINAPSTLQEDHKFHGKNVLVDIKDHTFEHSVYVYFTEGNTESCLINRISLSKGWNNQK